MSGAARPVATIRGHVPRDGRRHRTRARIAWALLAADVAAFVAICAFVDFDAMGTARGIAVMAVPMVGAIGLFSWGIAEAMAAPQFDRLAQPEGVLGSWIVDAGTWAERMALRAGRDGRPGIQGASHLPAKAPPAGFEIVVGDEGIFVGERVYLPTCPGFAGPAQVQGDWIELELPADSSTYVVRLPLGRDGRAAVDRVVQRLRARARPAPEAVPRPGV